MKPIDPLRIQSLVDGELSASEASAVQRDLAQSADAREIHESLRRLRTAVRENETPRTLPVAGDFYWQKIAERIQTHSLVPGVETEVQREAVFAFLVRRWMPIFGTLAILFVISGAVWFQFGVAGGYARLSTNHDIERTSQDVGTISFRSESEGITVVWLDTHPMD